MATKTEELLSALNEQQAGLDGAADPAQPWTPELVRFLSISVLGFSLLALLLVTVLLWRNKAPPQDILRVFGVIAIIGVSALLLIVGFGNEQLTPIVGLFGAIAGYLLGKDSATNKPDAKPNS